MSNIHLNNQSKKILEALQDTNNYSNLVEATGIARTTIRGRMSELKKLGLTTKRGEKYYLTGDGKIFLEQNGSKKIDV